MLYQKKSVLLFLSHKIVFPFLKYFIEFYLTSNFYILSALVSIKPISLSIYPTLYSSLFKSDQRILSKIAFAVRSLTILIGSSLIWSGHWIINKISLKACTKKALPRPNSSQFYSSLNFWLFFYFVFWLVWTYWFFFFFFPTFWFALLFFLGFLSIYSTYFYKSYSSDMTIIFVYSSEDYYLIYFYEIFLFLLDFTFVQYILPFWVLTKVWNHPQNIESMYYPWEMQLILIFWGLDINTAEHEPSWPH